MLKIEKNIIEKDLKYNNQTILKYHIEYPEITIENNQLGEERFNTYNRNLALRLQEKSENKLFNDSIELYKYNKENNYPTMVYEIYRKFEITFNSKNLISLYIDEYIFSGGAHGETTRTSQTWNFDYNTMIQLYELYSRNPYFLLGILKNINNQILQNQTNYFQDYCNLMLQTFNPQNFYLTPRGIVIYFQQYDIAPYSSGIPVFLV